MSFEKKSFGDFKVGDYVTFDRTYSHEDFSAFSDLSGDKNPLHNNPQYAQNSEFGECIVPLHLTSAPLSMIAGMIFPGDPSLYLGHELRSLSYVPFDCSVTYSAKIASINLIYRVLELDLLAFRTSSLVPVLEGKLRIQSREQEWVPCDMSELEIHGKGKWVLITGATGEIGSATAIKLAQLGYHLLLHCRQSGNVIDNVVKECSRHNVSVEVLYGDLSISDDLKAIAQVVASKNEIAAIVHVACPPVKNSLSDHIAISYSALKELVDAAMPNLLCQQYGAVILVGTSAMETPPPGWDSYVAGKSMAVNLVNTITNRYGHYGVSGWTVAPSLVQTGYSAPFRNEGDIALLPEEVGEFIADTLTSNKSDNYMLIEVSGKKQGQFGFSSHGASLCSSSESSEKGRLAIDIESTEITLGREKELELDPLIRRVLELPKSYDLLNAAIGMTPGWDSLRNIELLLTIERELGVSFSSNEIVNTHSYEGLIGLLKGK